MGLDSLRPLSVGELLDRAFRIYRSQALTLAGIVAVVLVPQGLIRFLAIHYINDTRLVDGALNLFLTPLLNVALISAISSVYLNRSMTISSAFSTGSASYWRVLGAGLLMGLAFGAPLILVGLCAALGGGIFVIILVIPFAIFFGTRWGLYTPAIVLEDIGASKGLSRSWQLTEGHFWRVFGTSFAGSLLTLFLSTVPILIVNYLLLSTAAIPLKTAEVIQLVVEQLALLLTLPFTIGVTVLIYYDLRIRREGFDILTMAKEVQAPAA